MDATTHPLGLQVARRVGGLLVERAEASALEHGVAWAVCRTTTRAACRRGRRPRCRRRRCRGTRSTTSRIGAVPVTVSGSSGSRRCASAEALRSSVVSVRFVSVDLRPAESDPDKTSIATTMTTTNSSVCHSRMDPRRRSGSRTRTPVRSRMRSAIGLGLSEPIAVAAHGQDVDRRSWGLPRSSRGCCGCARRPRARRRRGTRPTAPRGSPGASTPCRDVCARWSRMPYSEVVRCMCWPASFTWRESVSISRSPTSMQAFSAWPPSTRRKMALTLLTSSRGENGLVT